MFHLCWRQHGGSGLGLSWDEALGLLVGDRDWLLDRIEQQRAREAQEIRKAGGRR